MTVSSRSKVIYFPAIGSGLGKELFTSADNYIISPKDLSGASPVASALPLAAGLAIDVVYKEGE